MAMEQSVNTSALKPEEAVLLPALPRHSLSSRIALKDSLQRAAAMKDKKTGIAVDASRLTNGDTASASRAEKSVPAAHAQPPGNRPGYRAALYHILRRKG